MRKRRTIRAALSGGAIVVLIIVVLMVFFTAVSNLEKGHAGEDMRNLEEALRRAAVACYAAEGVYPPDLSYLQERYGVQIDSRRYAVSYIPIADNLMPDITILEKQ